MCVAGSADGKGCATADLLSAWRSHPILFTCTPHVPRSSTHVQPLAPTHPPHVIDREGTTLKREGRTNAPRNVVLSLAVLMVILVLSGSGVLLR